MAELSALQKRRKKNIYYSVVGAGLLSGIFLLANYVASFVPLRFDTTEGRVYSLSSGTKEILKSVDDTLIVRFLFSPDLPPRFKLNEKYIRDLLAEYRRAAQGKLRIELVDPSRSPKDKQDAIAAGVYPVQVNVIKKDKQEIQESFLGISLLYGDKKEAISFIQNTDGLEYEISQRIKKMVKPTEGKVGFITDAKALTLDSAPLKELAEPIRQIYQTVDISLMQDVPSDVKSLWLVGPREKLDPVVVDRIKTWVEKGGVLGLLIDKFDFQVQNFRPNPIETGLEDLLKGWGVDFRHALIVDPRSDRIQVRTSQGMGLILDYPYFPLITDLDRAHPATKNIDGISMPLVSPLFVDKPLQGMTYKPLGQSSSKSWLDAVALNVSPLQQYFKPTDAVVGPFNAALLLEGRFKPEDPEFMNPGRVIIFGCSRFVRTDYPLKQSNYALFANLLDWASQDEALLSIRAKGVVVRPLKQVSDVARALAKYAMILALPFLSILIGILIWTWNKKRIATLKIFYQGV